MPWRLKLRSTCRIAGPDPSSFGSVVATARAISSRNRSRPSPVRALTATTAAPGATACASSTASSSDSGSTRSLFVTATTPQSIPRARITARCSRVCGITPSSAATASRKRSTPVAPATMVLTRRSWPGTSTTETTPSGSSSGAYPRAIEMPRRLSSERRSVFFPVSASTSAVLPWSTCPAVPSVRARSALAKGAPRALGAALQLVAGNGAWIEDHPAVRDARDHRRVAPAKLRRQLVRPRIAGIERADRPGQLKRRQRASAWPGGRIAQLGAGADALDQDLGLAAKLVLGGSQHRDRRDFIRAALEVQAQSGLQGGELKLVQAHRAGEGMRAAGIDRGAGAGEDPGLRPAQELVGREANEIGAGRDRSADGRLVCDGVHRSGTEIVDEEDRASAGELGELRGGRLAREPGDAEVRLVDAQDCRRVGVDRIVVVGEAGPVRGPDLGQDPSRLGQDLRHPKRPTDLDQLSARDHDPATASVRRQSQQNRRGVVVDRDRGLGPR